jgi:hypothetical protein
LKLLGRINFSFLPLVDLAIHKEIMTSITKTKPKNNVASIQELPTVISPIRVIFLGATILFLGTIGFYFIPGMIAEDAEGTPIVNAFYCASITLMTYVSNT